MQYEPVIGLEIHAQLLTETKMFCGCRTTFGAPPDTDVCPVCLGLPGALPVVNGRAVDYAIKTALALGCRINQTSVFARKNYFYPDLPKGYQISQYDQPLAFDGRLEYVVRGVPHAVGIIRVHLEEDAGKSLHEGFADSDRRTHVDFNRSGVPLVEIVTRPDLRAAADAAEFFERLRAILVALGVNDGNMEEGSLRCDANISVRPAGQAALGTKTEVKNVNSFRFLQRALEYEIERQAGILQQGGRVRHETRLWDASAGRTAAMRSKEEAEDYRYFPDPDLPPLRVSVERIDAIRRSLPELPEARKRRLVTQYGLPEYDAALLTETGAIADYFEATAAAAGNAKAASNWVMGELMRRMHADAIEIDRAPVTPRGLAGLIRLIDRGTVSGTIAKDVFERMWTSGRAADEIVETEGLAQLEDEGVLVAAIERVIASCPGPVAEYRAGKTKTFSFLVGQVMKLTGGRANPQHVNELLRRALERT
jgi:aspartyl-tRNA(Asn)/glutamyl-tRNA(Gln) amidotransferase subunit B